MPQYEVQGYRVGTGFVFSFRGNQSVSYRFRGTDITRKLGSSCGCGKSDGGCCGKSDRTVIQCQGASCICSTENGCARASGKTDTFHIVPYPSSGDGKSAKYHSGPLYADAPSQYKASLATVPSMKERLALDEPSAVAVGFGAYAPASASVKL